MSDQIDLIYAPAVKTQLQEIYGELEAHQRKIIEISKTQIDFFGGKTVTNSQELTSNIDKYNKAQLETDKTLEKVRLSEIKLQQAREKAFDSYDAKIKKQVLEMQKAHEAKERAIQKELENSQKIIAQKEKELAASKRKADKEAADAAKLALLEEKKNLKAIEDAKKLQAEESRLENVYNKVQAKINALIPEYNNLATRRAIGVKLSDDEARRLDFLTGKLVGYQNILKKVDADIGKHGREVGNYAKANSNLSASIGQISRELPNFGQSFQVGVLSLTNNVGALLDALKQVRAENKALEAEGKVAKSAMSQVLSAILSWQTLLFIGIGIFSAYSKEISDWISSLWSANAAIKANERALIDAYEAQTRYTFAAADASKKTRKEIDDAKLMIAVLNDRTKTDHERLNVAQRLIDKYPGYLSLFSKEQLLAVANGEANTKLSESLAKLTEDIKLRNLAVSQAVEADKTFSDATDLQKEFEYREAINKKVASSDYATRELYKKRAKERAERLNDDDNYVAKFGEVTINELGAYDLFQINGLKKRYSLLIDEFNREKAQINKKLLATSLLDSDKDDKSSTAKKDPWGAVLAARMRYLKSYEDSSKATYEYEKSLKEKEISDIEKLAKDEQREFSDRITSYGELMQKRKELTAFNFAYQTEELIKQRDIELSESEKAHRAELKQTEGNAKATAAVNEYYAKERLEITKEYRAKQLSEELKFTADYLAIAEETAKIEVEINRKRREVLASTDKQYRDEQATMFKKAADNEKLSLEIRQSNFVAYIALKRKELDLEKILAIAKAGNNEAEIKAIKARFEIANRLLNEEEQYQSAVAKSAEKSKAALEALKKEFSGGFLSGAGLGSLTQFFDGSFNNIMKGFDQIADKGESTGKKLQYAFLAISETAQEVFNKISELTKENFDAMYADAERQYEVSKAFAGDGVEAKKKVDKEYEDKKRQIKNKEAKAEKELALFNIFMNTAQAVVAALPNYPLAIAVGALGALEYALVAGREVPRYFKGTQHHKGGLMLVNDGGGSDYQETVVTPDGNIEQPTGKNVLMNKPAGTKVFTKSQWKAELDSMLFSTGIDYASNISAAQNVINIPAGNGIDKYDIQDLKNVIKNKKEYQPIINKRGFNEYVIEGNTRKEILNNEVNSTGIDT